ncbi:MAG TPA: rhamnulokinase [Candidatus Merdivicinus intestinavium]|nr:rhamnulokinase [Candidatus Merdivicinus intestinavium]
MGITYTLAVDIGASSGRHILGSVQDGKIVLEEVYRFENGYTEKNGHFCWDFDRLFAEILNGMKRCGELGKTPVSMGIDTWGVDFVLLDENGKVLGDTVAYRDSRTAGMDEEVARLISPEELYARTGIQKQSYNTIYQLMAVKKEHPDYLEKAQRLLMTPEYFHYLLTGKAVNEYTMATTTQLVNAKARTWDLELLEKLGYPARIFGELNLPGTKVGSLKPEIAKQVGYSCDVVLPGTHDTASAVLAVPKTEENAMYISSGTWSLIGVERMEPDCSEKSRRLNFANEGGYGYRFRYLKNIMGLWMIQSVRREFKAQGTQYSFDDLCDLAIKADDFPSRVDVADDCFLAPKSMIEEVKDFCARTGQRVPVNNEELMACIYRSLADGYRKAVREMEDVVGIPVPCIHIVGGGSKDWYLNELTARATGKTVYAGPSEATALGNILAQMIAAGQYSTITEARRAVADSFAVKKISAEAN